MCPRKDRSRCHSMSGEPAPAASGSSRAGLADRDHFGERARGDRASTVGSRLSSSSGWTPAAKSLHRRAPAHGRAGTRRAWCRCRAPDRPAPSASTPGSRASVPAARASSGGNANRRTLCRFLDCRLPPATGARAASARGQIVCVGFTDEMLVPSASSILARSALLFSSVGKRTPTPWVRPPDAFAGVIQPTLPATG